MASIIMTMTWKRYNQFCEQLYGILCVIFLWILMEKLKHLKLSLRFVGGLVVPSQLELILDVS